MAEFYADGFFAVGFWADGFWAGVFLGAPVSPDVIVRVRGRHAEARSNVFTHHDGGMCIKDPADTMVVRFDFDAESLPASVTIESPTFTITAIRPLADEELTKDDEDTTEDARQAQCRLAGGTVGAVYRMDCRITTLEDPAQTIERSIFVKVEDR